MKKKNGRGEDRSSWWKDDVVNGVIQRKFYPGGAIFCGALAGGWPVHAFSCRPPPFSTSHQAKRAPNQSGGPSSQFNDLTLSAWRPSSCQAGFMWVQEREKLQRDCSVQPSSELEPHRRRNQSRPSKATTAQPRTSTLSFCRRRDNDEVPRRSIMASIGQHITGALRGSCQKPGFRRQCQASLGLDRQFQALRLDAGANKKRCMSTDSAMEEAIKAAPQIDFNAFKLARHARAVPISPSYFSRQARFNDSYLALQKLAQRYGNLPIIPSTEVERVTWSNLDDVRLILGEPVKAVDYAKCMRIVKHLHAIHPTLKPAVVTEALEFFKHSTQGFTNVAKPIPIDKFGRAVGVGKRKSSVARAWVVEGTGEIQVNGKNLAEAFGRVHDRESAVWALQATDRVDKYNVWAVVDGGGTTGQAEALTLAIAKGLMAHEPALKPALRRGETHIPRPTISSSSRSRTDSCMAFCKNPDITNQMLHI